MRDGWEVATLGRVLTRSTTVLGGGTEPPILTVTEGNGLVDQLEHWGRRIATEDVTRYKVVRPDALVYNVYLLWLGAIGRNATGTECITSPVYEVFDVAPSAEPRFVEHVVRSSGMRDAYAAISIGTVPRRRRTPWQAFLDLPILLPPRDQQRRIVDLIAAFDNAIEAAVGEAESASAILGAVLDLPVGEERAAVGDVASVASGASWGKSNVRDKAGEDTTPVLTIANTKPDGHIAGEPTYVAGLPPKTRTVAPGSLIAIRTNGNHARIGNVYRTAEKHLGAAVSAFQFLIDPVSEQDSAYLFWKMSAPGFQSAVTAASSGSTGLGNIAASKLRAIEISWPTDPASRAAAVQGYEAYAAVAGAARATTEALRELRSQLLRVLLAGEHEIPTSYDRLLEEAA